jgi:SNF2 family DNA or RNA helicase
MIRRKKSDVLKDLPDKTYAFVPMQLRNKMEYQEAERDFIAWLRKEKGLDAAERAKNAETFASIEGLKQLAVKGKLHDCMLWITDFLETDNKLVVFATHKFVIDELMKKFGELAVKIDGSVSMNQRQNAVDQFQQNNKVITVVGCGGDRDKTKRPLMAKAGCVASDRVILTSDNPRTEDPEAILNDMEAGVPVELKPKVLRISDRLQAIRTAVALAKDGDIILLAAKGHEKYQDIQGIKHPFDDKAILSETLLPL